MLLPCKYFQRKRRHRNRQSKRSRLENDDMCDASSTSTDAAGYEEDFVSVISSNNSSCGSSHYHNHDNDGFARSSLPMNQYRQQCLYWNSPIIEAGRTQDKLEALTMYQTKKVRRSKFPKRQTYTISDDLSTIDENEEKDYLFMADPEFLMNGVHMDVFSSNSGDTVDSSSIHGKTLVS